MPNGENYMTPSYGWGSTVSRLQSYYEETAYFLTGILGTHFIDLRRMKGQVDFGAIQWF